MNDEQIQVIQIPTLDQSVPFTIGLAASTESHAIYAFSGRRTLKFWGIAMMFLGILFLPAGVVLAVDPLVNPTSNNPSSLIYGLIFSGVCGLLLIVGRLLIIRSGTRFQIEINRASGSVKLIRRKKEPWIQSNGSVFHCGMLDVSSRKPQLKYWCVSIATEEFLLVLAALQSKEKAYEFAEVVGSETGLPIQDRSQTHALSTVYFEDLVRTDSDALKNPMRAKPF